MSEPVMNVKCAKYPTQKGTFNQRRNTKNEDHTPINDFSVPLMRSVSDTGIVICPKHSANRNNSSDQSIVNSAQSFQRSSTNIRLPTRKRTVVSGPIWHCGTRRHTYRNRSSFPELPPIETLRRKKSMDLVDRSKTFYCTN